MIYQSTRTILCQLLERPLYIVVQPNRKKFIYLTPPAIIIKSPNHSSLISLLLPLMYYTKIDITTDLNIHRLFL